jgi:hypothetical protein
VVFRGGTGKLCLLLPFRKSALLVRHWFNVVIERVDEVLL